MKMYPYFLVVVLLQSSCISNRSDLLGRTKQKNILNFKTWLRETISIIEKDGMPNNRKYEVGNDSLSIEIFKSFKVESDNPEVAKSDTMVANVISLLKEYNELPLEKFSLSFTTSEYYSQNSSISCNYDYLFDIQDLIITKHDTIVQYNYIRGSLSGKTAYKNGNKIYAYDFNWIENKLEKVLLK